MNFKITMERTDFIESRVDVINNIYTLYSYAIVLRQKIKSGQYNGLVMENGL